MTANHLTVGEADVALRRNGERGSALFIAMILILILTFMGFAFLTRTLLVSQIAGAERWTTKAFFAADSGMSLAKARLRVRQLQGFTVNIQDLRGYAGTGDRGDVTVTVSDFNNVGVPVLEIGTQNLGGQGPGSEPLYTVSYRGISTSVSTVTRSEAVVTATQSLEHSPLGIPGS